MKKLQKKFISISHCIHAIQVEEPNIYDEFDKQNWLLRDNRFVELPTNW